MRKILLPLLALSAFILFGCSRQSPLAPSANNAAVPPETHIDTAPLDRLERLAAQRDGGLGEFSAGRQLIVVSAGSTNALAGAIAAAGTGGVVLLKAGPHIESGTVKITTPVTVLGETGAELVSEAGTAEPGWWHPALDVRADPVAILGLTIRSSRADAQATGIWIGAGGDDALVFNNRISGFLQPVLINRANRVKVWANRLDVAAGGDGMDIVNGAAASVLRNEILHAGFVGMFLSGTNGQVAFNRVHDCYIGILFCKVPAGALPLPEGGTDGSDVSAAGWLGTENATMNNSANGILLIDGANHNVVWNNLSTGNGTYDVELAGDSYRFGFLTPASYDNTFIAGRYPNTEVKNCGTNNTIIGGALVNNTAEPCD